MKKWIFSLLAAGCLGGAAAAQEGAPADTLAIVHQLEGCLTDVSAPRPAVAQRLHADYAGWRRLLPTHVKLQYAGGMGLASLGAGWDYGRRNQWETDLQIGLLPAYYTEGGTRATFTLKQNYLPWNIRCHDRFGIEPFACGLYLNLITGPGYWYTDPAKYGGGYYRFASRLRAYVYVGQRATWYHRRPGSLLRSVTLYYELSAKELDLLAKCTNRKLTIPDIFYFSFGVKVRLMRP